MSDASVILGLDAREFDARLAALEGKIQGVGKTASQSFGGLGGGLKMLGAAVSVGAVAAEIKSVIDYGAHVQDLSDRFGVSTDAIQHFGNAAEKNGSSLEGMTMGFNKMLIARSRALEGQQPLVDAFIRLGVSIQDLQKLQPEQIMEKIGASSMNAADMVKVLGKTALELRTTLAGIADKNIEIGPIINPKAIAELKDADDVLKKIKEKGTILAGKAISGVMEGPKGTWDELKKSGTLAWQAVTAAARLHFKESGRLLKEQAHVLAYGIRKDANHPGPPGTTSDGGKGISGTGKANRRTFDTEDDAREVTLEQIREKAKLSLPELAERNAYGEDAIYRNKYIGGDILKAQEAMREKGVIEDLTFAGRDDEAKLHMDRFTQLTSGIGSLQEKDKGLGGITEKVNSIEKSAQEIVKNTAQQFVNK
jgi:hypothetical protein